MKSTRSLKRRYDQINKRYFLDELPRNVIVRWAEPGEEKDTAGTGPCDDGRHSYEVLLNREKNLTQCARVASLVHEMIHIATGFRDDHGPVFDEWRRKLDERGIFKKNALIRGQTIF